VRERLKALFCYHYLYRCSLPKYHFIYSLVVILFFAAAENLCDNFLMNKCLEFVQWTSTFLTVSRLFLFFECERMFVSLSVIDVLMHIQWTVDALTDCQALFLMTFHSLNFPVDEGH